MQALTDAIGRISTNQSLALNQDINLVIGSLTGRIPILDPTLPVRGLPDQAAQIIAQAVDELADGTVISYPSSRRYAVAVFTRARAQWDGEHEINRAIGQAAALAVECLRSPG